MPPYCRCLSNVQITSINHESIPLLCLSLRENNVHSSCFYLQRKMSIWHVVFSSSMPSYPTPRRAKPPERMAPQATTTPSCVDLFPLRNSEVLSSFLAHIHDIIKTRSLKETVRTLTMKNELHFEHRIQNIMQLFTWIFGSWWNFMWKYSCYFNWVAHGKC